VKKVALWGKAEKATRGRGNEKRFKEKRGMPEGFRERIEVGEKGARRTLGRMGEAQNQKKPVRNTKWKRNQGDHFVF